MKKLLYLLYAVVCYLIFLGTFLYFIGFTANLFVPKSIDAPNNYEIPLFLKILIDLGLIGLFGVQHSVMARQGFKRKWTRIVPEPIERSTYVLFSSMVMILLLFFWQPIPAIIWNAGGTAGYVLLSISFIGWSLVFLSTYLINHFHLFGLKQVYDYSTNKKEEALKFGTPFLYKIVRHPLYMGFLIAFWAAPVMTVGHLLFSIAMTLYIFIGIYHEEKDLVNLYGSDYVQYKKKTPKIVPFSKS